MPPPYDQNAVISFCPPGPEPSPVSGEGPSLGALLGVRQGLRLEPRGHQLDGPRTASPNALARLLLHGVSPAPLEALIPYGAIAYLTSLLMAGLPGFGLGA